ncbi:P450 family sporulation-specific N-formyltyrosine oxidase Dit2 [Trichoderma chlorosporum]
MFYFFLLLLPAFLLCILAYATRRPNHFPRNIPRLPIWVQVYDRVRRVSRIDFYNSRIRPLIEKRGAVAFWNEGQWAIMVTKSEYVVQIFKNADHSLKKNGLHHRAPHSNGARLFGENIFDSDDQLHAHFSKILKPGFSRQISIEPMRSESNQLARKLCEAQGLAGKEGSVLIGSNILHWAISIYSEYFMDSKTWPSCYSEIDVHRLISPQNKHWVGRVKGLFPIIDSLPWKLSSYLEISELVQRLENALLDHADERNKMPPSQGGESKIVYLLHQARQQGELSDFHYRSNLKQLLIAGYQNLEAALNSTMYELSIRTDLQDLLYAEVTQLIPVDYSPDDLERLPLLKAVINEVLRLYPPSPDSINRRTTEPFQLGNDITIPAGTLIGWQTYGIQTDSQVWGESAHQFDPFRWGKDCASINRMTRSYQLQGLYIPFSSHSRRCLGSTLALTQLKVAVVELVRHIKWTVSPQNRFQFNKAFLVGPDKCNLVIHKRDQ